MRKLFTLFTLLLLCLLPITALAAAPSGQVIYVGNEDVTSGGYWTTDSDGTVTACTAGDTPRDNYIRYDAGNNILTLHNATIKKGLAYDQNTPAGSTIHGSAIGVLNQSGDAELTVQLEGSNMIDEVSTGIYVHSSGGGAALSIAGNGTLFIDSTFCPIQVISFNGNAALSIENAKVTATSSYYNGVTVQSGNSENSSASLTVNGGSLTATASSENVSGISLSVGADGTGDCTPTVTVSNNAIVRAKGSAGGITSNSSTGVQYGTGSNSTGGIVFDGNTGTVYGEVALQDDLTINQGETLTIGDGASLNTGEHEVIVDGGTLDGEDKITGTVKYAPAITTQPTSQTVTEGETATFTVVATGSDLSYQWQQDANGSDWTNISENATSSTYTISNTTSAMNNYQYRCVVSNSAGSVTSSAATLTVEEKTVPVTGVTLNPATLELYTDGTGTLTATVEPSNATNKNVTWSSDNTEVATVDQTGTVTAVGAGKTTITVTTDDGGKTATCQVTVEYPVFTISVNTKRLDFGTVTEGYTEAPAAKEVTITNAGNQPLTLTQSASSGKFEVGALSKTKLAVFEEATFTVRPKAGLSAGTYDEDITVFGNGGATMTITASFNVRKEVKVKASGSTNLSFTTDRDEFTLTATVYAQGNVLNPTDGSWTWTVADDDVVALSGSPTLLRAFASSSRQAFKVEGTGTTTITATYDDGTYRGSVDFTVHISKPTPPDPISYYNIYVEDVCDGVEVTTSKNVVREGGSISLYVEKDTADYDFDNFQVYYKRSYYGPWEVLEEGVQPGEYPINNIWTHIYVKAEGAEEKEDPTGIEQVEGVKVYTKDGSLYVQTPQREQVLVISMTGVVVKNEEQVGLKQYHGLQPGIYVVRIGERAYKLRLH